MKRASLLLLLGPLSLLGASGDSPVSHVVRSETEIFTMGQVYKSMFGPRDRDFLTLLETDSPEVLWITAIKADMVAADGTTPASPEYFCHSVLSRLPSQPLHRRLLIGPGLGMNEKIFTLVQGLNEIRFPEGFAMPVLSNDRFVSTVMAMNPLERAEPVRVGVDSRIEYVRESELDREMEPLFLVPLVTKLPLEGQGINHSSHAGHDASHENHEHGDDGSCLSPDAGLETARSVDRTGATPRSPITLSDSGILETGHWYVPPGRHVYRYRLGRLDATIPFDTRAHYIASHLHPYGESLELIDLTTGQSVFKAIASNYPDRVAVQNITHYSSREGIPIYGQHEYEIVAVYDNPTGEDVDSMAVMYLYLHDSAEKRAAASGGREGPAL
jgi:hypothetical protein